MTRYGYRNMDDTPNTSELRCALRCATVLKIPVFPVVPGEKKPLTTHGVLDATTDPEVIAAWWQRWPHANIGGATGFVSDALDLDGVEPATWSKVTGFTLPTTWQLRTPSGGVHLHFQAVSGLKNVVKRLPYADVRARGGYVLLPPSRTARGQYTWIAAPGMTPLAAWPADLLQALTPPPMPPPSSAPRPEGITIRIPASLLAWADRGASLGQQTACAFWLACRLRQHGADDAEGWAVMERFAAACTPPANRQKLARIWRDSIKYQGYQPTRTLREPQRRASVPLPTPTRRASILLEVPS